MDSRRIFSLICTLSLPFVLLFCKEVETRNIESESDILDHTEYSNFESVELWHQAHDGSESFVGAVNVVDGLPEISDAVLKGAYGDRSEADKAVDLGLHIRVKYKVDQSGSKDLMYLQPVLLENKELNASTTSLYLFIYENFKNASSNVNMSYQQWKKILVALDLYCSNCRFLNVKSTIDILKGNSSLRDEIFAILKPDNLNLAYQEKALDQWKSYPLESTVRLVNGVGQLDPIVETETVTLSASFVHPSNFSKAHKISDWLQSQDSILVDSFSDEEVEKVLDYDSSGTHRFIGTSSSSDVSSLSAIFSVLVGNTNRAPTLSAVPLILAQENHEISVDLNSYKLDPDGDTALTISLEEAPNGVFAVAGILTWNPTTSQVGNHTIKVRVADSESLFSQTYDLSATVSNDNLPFFDSPPLTVVFNEGIETTLDFTATDTDGDALTITVLNTSVKGILKDFPIGARWNSSPSMFVGPSGAQDYTFYYWPSYYETQVSANKLIPVTFLLSYNTATPGLRGFGQIQQIINLQVLNQDDPPIWSGTPADETITDNGAFSFPLAGGLVADSTYSPTVLSYSLTLASPSCSFITIDPSTGTISGTANDIGPALCRFEVNATDANGLIMPSSEVIYSVTNVNQLPSTVGSIPAQAATENIQKTLNMKDYFTDPDDLAGDEQEQLEFICGNCVAKGIQGLQISTSGALTWKPSYLDAGTYAAVEIQMTDAYMRANSIAPLTQLMDITVSEASAPPVLTFTETDLTIDENDTQDFSFDVDGFSGAAIDIYDYDVDIECFGCRSGFVTLSGVDIDGSTGSLKTIDLSFASNFADGDSEDQPFKVYSLRAKVTKKSDSTVSSEQNFSIRVENVNQAPTSLSIQGNTDAGAYAASIDLSNALNRFIEFELTIALQDPDGSNDTYTYSFEDTTSFPPFGDLDASTGAWTYIPILCVPGGGQTASRSFKISGQDSGGNKITRQVDLSVLDTTDTPICP